MVAVSTASARVLVSRITRVASSASAAVRSSPLVRSSMARGISQIATLSMATGMINPTLSGVGGESVSLTFVTGTLKRLADHLASAVVQKSSRDSRGPLDSPLRRAAVDASLWSGFLVGATIAGLVVSHAETWALVPPGAILICLAASGRFDRADSPPTHP